MSYTTLRDIAPGSIVEDEGDRWVVLSHLGGPLGYRNVEVASRSTGRTALRDERARVEVIEPPYVPQEG